MPDEIFTHPNFVIKEEVTDLESSTDVATEITLETDNDRFIFTFVYNNLIAFVRCKK